MYHLYTGLYFDSSFDVYGGEVEGTSNATAASEAQYGIYGKYDSAILTVYGGKVKGAGNGKGDLSNSGSGFRCKIQSGTTSIKFYYSDNGTTWGPPGGEYIDTAKPSAWNRYAKAE